MGIVILIILFILCFGAFPSWNYNSNWGYGPSGILGVILIIFLILFVMRRL